MCLCQPGFDSLTRHPGAKGSLLQDGRWWAIGHGMWIVLAAWSDWEGGEGTFDYIEFLENIMIPVLLVLVTSPLRRDTGDADTVLTRYCTGACTWHFGTKVIEESWSTSPLCNGCLSVVGVVAAQQPASGQFTPSSDIAHFMQIMFFLGGGEVGGAYSLYCCVCPQQLQTCWTGLHESWRPVLLNPLAPEFYI